MKLSEARKILKHHNDWRRGADIPVMNSTDLGVAIEIILQSFNRIDVIIPKLRAALRKCNEK